MLNTDFKGLLIKLLELISQMVISQNIVIENKFIVENSLNLVISIIINQPDLLRTLIDFKSEFAPQFESGKDLILQGLLYSTEDKIRNDFRNSLEALSLSLNSGDTNALNYMLSLLAQNFKEVSNRPCTQFFDLFNSLIDQKATRDDKAGELADGDDEKISYDPEQLLTQIIERFKDSQKLQQTEEKDDEAGDEEKMEDMLED